MKLTRRNFLAGGAAVAAASTLPSLPQAAPAPTVLRVVKRTLEVNGRAASVFGIQQPDGKSGLATIYKAPFSVRLENHIADETLVHWHGLTPPSNQDGVPTLSQPLLPPGAAYEYNFPLQRAGTFWMHSHHGLQEQALLAAPLILPDDVALYPRDDAQEVVMMLHDFSFQDPQEIYAELTGGMPMMDHSKMSQGTGMEMGGGMAGMEHGHLNDVEYDAYLANDRTLDDPEIVQVESGRAVRLRIINAAAATNFVIGLGELQGDVIAVDGSECRRRVSFVDDYVGRGNVGHLRGRRFGLAMAQRIDIRIDRLPSGAHPILARREGDRVQTGIILATPGAAIARVPARAAEAAPALDLRLDQQISTADKLRAGRADRHHRLELTGSMMGFAWSLNGRKFGEHQPITVRQGEFVKIEMVNRTDMSHPMHLHGHRFQVVEIDGEPLYGPVRDTVLVPVNGRVTIAFDADNPGRWALHCHNLYHMNAGMMTTLEYEA